MRESVGARKMRRGIRPESCQRIGPLDFAVGQAPATLRADHQPALHFGAHKHKGNARMIREARHQLRMNCRKLLIGDPTRMTRKVNKPETA